MSTRILSLLAAIIFVVACRPANANAVYIANSAAGSANGSSCGNAYAVSYFNNGGNWTGGVPAGTQIGPGTVVHLCGTFTGAAGSTMLTAQGSGSSGSKITILFEANAKLSAPYFDSAIVVNGVSNIIIDGGANGIIEDTLSGSSGTSCTGGTCIYHNNSIAILAKPCSSCEIKNLTIQNLYKHQSSSDESVDQNFINAVNTDGGGINIHHNTFHDIGWAIAAAHSNITVANNSIYNFDHAYVMGAGTGETVTGIIIHDNHFGAMANWDDNANGYHHDGIHLFAQTTNDQIYRPLIYNNLFDGDSGINVTANCWFESVVNSAVVFNNVFISTGSRFRNDGALGWASQGDTVNIGFAYNNTILGTNYSDGSCLAVRGLHGFTGKNNAIQGCRGLIGLTDGTSITSSGLNNNVYQNTYSDRGINDSMNYNGNFGATLSSWQSLTGQESASKFSTLPQMNLSATGHPQAGSSLIGAGANLTSLCTGDLAPLCRDAAGVARPTSGAWTAGAFQSEAVSTPPPNPPTGLTGTVH